MFWKNAANAASLIEIALRPGCSPVNLTHIFRTSFPWNVSGWLLLMSVFVKSGRKQMEFLFIKRVISNGLIIINYYRYYQSVLTFLRKLFSILFSPNNNQSGFRLGVSCVHQLLSIMHIYKAFDANPLLEMRGVFLPIKKFS